MLEASGGSCARLISWPCGRVPLPRVPSTFRARGDEKYGLGPYRFALASGLPPPASLPSFLTPPFRRKRDGLFYWPLAWNGSLSPRRSVTAVTEDALDGYFWARMARTRSRERERANERTEYNLANGRSAMQAKYEWTF